MLVRGNEDVAECYGVELMRLYDHYRFNVRPPKRRRGDAPPRPKPPPRLVPSDEWTDRYFKRNSLEARDRERFGPSV